MTRQQRRAAERERQKEQRKQARNQFFVVSEISPQPTEANAPHEIAATSGVISEARLAANRLNAQLSTGAQTEAGKANSSQNAFKHGLYSRQLIIPGENPAELDALKLELREEHQPATLTEELLVNEIAEHYWRLRRARLAEARLLQGEFNERNYTAVHRAMTAAERGFHKALKVLRELQKHRGFVPQNLNRPVAAVAATATDNTATGTASEQTATSQTGEVGFVPQNEQPTTGYKSHLEYMASRTDLEPTVRDAIRQIAAI